MIHSLKVTDPSRLTVGWWSKVESLSKIDTLEFGPGMNILWGRNASGKSTILRLLAEWFHCYQGGRSVVTETSIRGATKSLAAKDVFLDGAEIKHDGQSVSYFNPEKPVGFSGSQFDDDFMEEGIFSMFRKGSSGQNTLHGIMTAVRQKSEEKIPFNMHKDRVNTLWQGWIEGVERMLTPNSPPGPRTILLDEPDRSLDIDNSAEVWRQIPFPHKPRQIIVATHSPFALRIEGAKYIELSPGYLETCRNLFPGKGAS